MRIDTVRAQRLTTGKPIVQAVVRQHQRALDGAPGSTTKRHCPEQTTLYQLVKQHAARFQSWTVDSPVFRAHICAMNMPPYDPGTFVQLFGEPRGQRLWAKLNTREYVSCLETATALHQPAVKGIEEPLLRDFGADVMEDRFKQMIGHMVRQVMERHGYEVDQQKVKIDSIPFYAGTRYKRRDEWVYHVWRKSKDPRACALTADKQGAQLPAQRGERWLYWRSFSGLLRASVMFGMHSEEQARKDILRQGYHLVTMSRVVRPA